MSGPLSPWVSNERCLSTDRFSWSKTTRLETFLNRYSDDHRGESTQGKLVACRGCDPGLDGRWLNDLTGVCRERRCLFHRGLAVDHRPDSVDSGLAGRILATEIGESDSRRNRGGGGGAVMAHPFYGMAALTLVLATFFAIEGIWKVVSSFSYRPMPGWIALLMSGALDLILGILIWRQWPVSGLWAVGLLVGVSLLSTGIALVALAITWKRTVYAVKSKIEAVKERLAE